MLSEKEREFAQRLVTISKEYVQSEVLNKVESWRGDVPNLIDNMAKWGSHYSDDNYVCLRYGGGRITQDFMK